MSTPELLLTVDGYDPERSLHVLLVYVLAGIIAVVLFALVLVVQTMLLRLRHGRRAEHYAALEAVWKPAILATITGRSPGSLGMKDAETLNRFLIFLRQYQQRVRGAARQRLARLGSQFVGRLLPLLEHERPDYRAQAVRFIGEYGGVEAEPAIARCLNDPVPVVSIMAMQALAPSVESRHVQLVLDQLDRFENWSTSYLVSICTEIHPRNTPRMRALMADLGRTPHARIVAAETLREMNDTRSVAVAIRLLESGRADIDSELAASLLRLVAKFGTAQSRGVILDYLGHESPFVRIHAIGVLASLGNVDDLTSLVLALDDPSPWVVMRAARGLVQMGRKDLLEARAASSRGGTELLTEFLREVA